jgi:excisionase family DNA binding protein
LSSGRDTLIEIASDETEFDTISKEMEKKMSEEDRWLTRNELAARLGVPEKTPAQWATKGTGPYYVRFGRHVRYRLSDVIAWEHEQLVDVA